MTKIVYAFAIAMIFASLTSPLQSEIKSKKEYANTSAKTTTRKEDLCTSIEYTHTMLIEKFFVDALNIFKGIKPACICVQLCKDKPTYCYPNGCIHEVRKCTPNDEETEITTQYFSKSTEEDSTIKTTVVSPNQNLENSIFPDPTEDVEAIYIRQLLMPTEMSSTQEEATEKEGCHSSTTPTSIVVSHPFPMQTKLNLWSKMNQKRLPHPYIGPQLHTPQESTLSSEEISTLSIKVRNVPQKIISEKTHWPSNGSFQMHSHKTYGDDNKENWLYEIFDDTYKSTLAQSDDYDTVIDDDNVDKFQHSLLANLHNEEMVNEYFDKNTYDKSITDKNNINNNRLTIPDFTDDYNTDDRHKPNNFSVTPDVPIIKGKVTNRWGSELDYAYDYTDNGTSRDPLNDVVIHNYSSDLNSPFGLRYTEPLYKSKETHSYYNTTEKINPNTLTVTESNRLKLDRQNQVQNFSPFLADRNNYIEKKTNNKTFYVMKPNTNRFDSNQRWDNIDTYKQPVERLAADRHSTMYDQSDSEEDEYRVSRKSIPTGKSKPRQYKVRRTQNNISRRNNMNMRKKKNYNDQSTIVTRKPVERTVMLRYETNSPNKRLSTQPAPENIEIDKFEEKNKKITKHSSNSPFYKLGRRDGAKHRLPEDNRRKRREKSFRNPRRFLEEVRTTTSAYNQRNSRDLRRNREGVSKTGFRENRKMAHRTRFNRIKQAG